MLRQLLCFIAVLGLSHSLPNQLMGKSSERLGELNRYLHFTRSRMFTPALVSSVSSITDTFISNTDILIVIHGHEGTPDSDISLEMKYAIFNYLSNDINLVVVDWSAIAGSAYDFASGAVVSVAHHLTAFIENIYLAGFTPEQVHLIGFDLGAHVAGFASRSLSTPVSKITGLSPRGDGWPDSRKPLAQGDAQYVEIIHTSSVLGINRPLGDIDFFINGGESMPGCDASDNQCDHIRAYQIMGASIGHTITGNQCVDIDQVGLNQCLGRGVRVGSLEFKFGFGIYRANTVAAYPYQ